MADMQMEAPLHNIPPLFPVSLLSEERAIAQTIAQGGIESRITIRVFLDRERRPMPQRRPEGPWEGTCEKNERRKACFARWKDGPRNGTETKIPVG